ncbi:Flp pilus assembly protein CpaB [Tropicimonas sp. IMCC6043]|uniref:Flp pilus assembly protein CpaB n=1 Tax=Tropicimonas sp. IMCC6043 TaxID=2510645 RepID=UPI00101D0CCB|nr:Flp pilus assembly protein CpaB [Tropicimonas sp. IMCC6043]RYH11295.1 Flp pilus assembly protein CpaB [Tropicimonas sp. IMCC6043]
MRLSALITALTGLAVAGGSVYLARDYIRFEPATAEASAESETVGVIVAARDISFGEAIEPGTLTAIEWPRAALPAGVYTDYEELLAASNQPPRRARRPIAQGELLLTTKISDFGEKVTIVQTIGANNRAMAIEVDAETAVGGFVTPGDRVDIVMTEGAKENMRAITILQNIRVIGVDQEADEQTDSPSVARTVTVEVTPDQGQRLALAQRAGRLSLTLRSIEDTEDRTLEMTRLHDLLQDPDPETVEEVRKSVIRVRRGTDMTEAVIN